MSTIIPVRNRRDLLLDAVGSVLAQTYRPIEVIIIDGGSTDGTVEAARELERAHAEVRFLAGPMLTIPSARNAGLDQASGEFVQFLDSDDLLMRDKFAQQVAALRAHPACGISYCRTREYRIGGPWSGLPARRTGYPHAQLFPQLLMGRIWATPSPLYRREVIEQNGPVAETVIYEDWEFEARAGARGVRLHHCDEYLADKRDVHHVAGAQKGGTRRYKMPDYARMHHRVYEHAVAAGVSAADLDRYAAKLFAAGRGCAADGFEPEARGLIVLARRVSLVTAGRLRIGLYAALSNRLGWETVGRRARTVEQSAPAKALKRARHWPNAMYRKWRHRVVAARQTISGQAFAEWPHLLAARWAGRQSRQRLVR